MKYLVIVVLLCSIILNTSSGIFGIVNATPSTQGTLTVIKQIDMQAEGGVAPSPSQFTIEVVFSRDGNEADPGSSSGIDYERPAGTTYHVGEISAPGIDSFPRFVGDCGRDEFGNVEEDTIEAGETKTCTVTNVINVVENGPVTEEGTESQIAGPEETEEFNFQSGLEVPPGANLSVGAFVNITTTCNLNNETCAGIANEFLIVPFSYSPNELISLGEFPTSERGRLALIAYNASYPVQYEVKVFPKEGLERYFYVYPYYSYDCEGKIKAGQTKQCNIQITLDPRR